MIIKKSMKYIKQFMALCVTALVCTSTQCEDPPIEKQELRVRNTLTEIIFVNVCQVEIPDNDFKVPYYRPDCVSCKISARSVNSCEIVPYRVLVGDSDPFYRFVVLKQSTLDRYSGKIEEVLEKNIYDSVFVYSLAELKAMNYRITYSED